mmetsp:Transcript_18945/g.34208  ORF Transcript_18945/g.34208 Transcript_18945/m.34208 type:complete len:311 (+) Transcript_18945:36-968(+)
MAPTGPAKAVAEDDGDDALPEGWGEELDVGLDEQLEEWQESTTSRPACVFTGATLASRPVSLRPLASLQDPVGVSTVHDAPSRVSTKAHVDAMFTNAPPLNLDGGGANSSRKAGRPPRPPAQSRMPWHIRDVEVCPPSTSSSSRKISIQLALEDDREKSSEDRKALEVLKANKRAVPLEQTLEELDMLQRRINEAAPTPDPPTQKSAHVGGSATTRWRSRSASPAPTPGASRSESRCSSRASSCSLPRLASQTCAAEAASSAPTLRGFRVSSRRRHRSASSRASCGRDPPASMEGPAEALDQRRALPVLA